MSQITIRLSVMGLLLLGLVVLVGCGSDANTQAPFDSDAQQHAAGWLPAGHMTAAQPDGASCQECHGADFSGGISKVSCTTCHLGGALSVHPATWEGDAILTSHGPYVVANGSLACANVNCHGADLKGVVNSGPSCGNFANDNRCHMTYP
jgi:hypothetical protein